ncbi:MAG: hypothetical protein H0U54_09320 [Acidobacteria bacterium]|nr:hypothetical protein [Acidobacteriota bacterium]
MAHLERIDRESTVIPDSFEMIGKADSVGLHHVQRLGPFDVINLDLCDSLAPLRQNVERPSYHEALVELLNFQIRERANPWILFVSTRADPSTVSEAIWQYYLPQLADNLRSSGALADQLEQNVGVDGVNALKDLKLPTDIAQQEFARLFGLGFSKWLLSVMWAPSPNWHLELLPSCWYRVSAEQPDMLSLCFRFKQITEARIDPSGLVAAPPASPQISERDLAVQICGEMSRVRDLDALLRDDPEELETMIRKGAGLLKHARYDEGAYDEWARISGPAQ